MEDDGLDDGSDDVTGLADDSGMVDYLDGDDSSMDDNAGANLDNATASSPVITDTNGNSTANTTPAGTSGGGSSLTSAAQNAANSLLKSATTAAQTQLATPLTPTSNATATGTPTATVAASTSGLASVGTSTWLLIGAGILALLFFMRKRA